MPRKLSKPWIEAYKDYVYDTETPLNFINWSAISILSSSLKRNVFMKRDFNIYPNQYIILTGPPGVGKGTAINPAAELAKKADTVNYLNDRITAERIIEKLALGFTRPALNSQGIGAVIQDSSATILSTELPVFLGSSEWMLPYLCEMWDRGSFTHDTKTKGTKEIKDLCVSLLGGCVPDYIRKINKDSQAAITGGFTSRCIYVYAEKPGKDVDWPEIKTGTQLETDLLDDLKHVGFSLRGEMQFEGGKTGKAFQAYNTYRISARQNGKFEQQVIVNFKSRAPTHMLKTAMTLSISESDDLIVRERHIQAAVKMIEDVQGDLEKTFRFVGENQELVAAEYVMDYLESVGSASYNQILTACYRYCNDDLLRKIMNTMVLMDAVKLMNGQYIWLGKKKGKP